MAQRVQVILEDDIDGGTAAETVTFGLDGSSYEIDLSKKNAAKLRDALSPYVANARRAGRATTSGKRGSGRSSARSDRNRIQAIREWARTNGYAVSDRGRIPAAIVEAYETSN
jgi:Lsr2